MTQFEFISVFASIIMGLGLAHLFTGALQQIYRGRTNYLQTAYGILALLLIVLNWWGLFAWKDEPAWSLIEFFVLVLWSLSMLAVCVAVYPPGDTAHEDFESHRRVLLLSVASVGLLDIAQTALHGALFTPVYYLPWVIHFVVLALIGAAVRGQLLQRAIATYFPITTFIWGFIWTAGAMG